MRASQDERRRCGRLILNQFFNSRDSFASGFSACQPFQPPKFAAQPPASTSLTLACGKALCQLYLSPVGSVCRARNTLPPPFVRRKNRTAHIITPRLLPQAARTQFTQNRQAPGDLHRQVMPFGIIRPFIRVILMPMCDSFAHQMDSWHRLAPQTNLPLWLYSETCMTVETELTQGTPTELYHIRARQNNDGISEARPP